MYAVKKVEHWGDLHHAKWLHMIRIILGLLILFIGILFINQTEVQQDWIIQINTFGFSGLMAVAVLHIVAFVLKTIP